ncbi:unnamed protein product [Penicillium salamii]|uniref:Zn(2)-C6 fungal-type domain-containing protein n=1 Tax=Penicillium salamii TaxID=1612424 RepID=A0A9W4ND75_9EURO|nr:unnamed protein product [Penicillium salamii]CAG8040894.1 unnamed protein product [Penicillium salamii]CAG8342334.1 unnamed protein product [Penicillium salamii]CAG8342339.1 unnamed protein product [Penicillium salamii]CAG8342505.1 unnamed protein product [Penicillium salamii]
MPPRFTHRKSTTGCLRCKARKVKCDEQRPDCSHCTRHGVTCEWPTLKPRMYNPDKPKAVTRRVVQPSPRPSLPSPELGSMRILEMRLVHQWVTETCNTMSSAKIPTMARMWGVSVPKMAFEYEPLLHTLLALGAAHRSTLLPQEASALRPVYHGYIDSAIQRHRPVTAQLDETTTDAVCFNTVLLSLYTLFLRSEPSKLPYNPPVMWLTLAQGIRTVIKSVYTQLVANNSPLCPLLFAAPDVWRSADREERIYTGPMKPLQFLLHYRQEDDAMDQATLEVYEEAVAYIERFYIAVQKGEEDYLLRRMFSGFPPVIPQAYIGYVAARRPRALVILAYAFALIHEHDDIWWLRGIPAREVEGINSLIPPDWKWLMIWPCHVIAVGSAQGQEVPIPRTSTVVSEVHTPSPIQVT